MTMMLKGTHAELIGIYTGIHAKFSKGDFYSIGGLAPGKMPLQWHLLIYEPDNEQNDEQCIAMHSNETIADTISWTYELVAVTTYKFHNIALNYSRAFMACSAEGLDLAIINSEVEGHVLSAVRRSRNGQLEDRSCSERASFVCEKSVDSLLID
ncbi:unnamed protein product [Leptosia nina]|uniref:Uncharacterized protein n=1 Tax=Leptosia nina TaxID=320188 RepID=A0AAV1JBU5_9NEOP